MLWKTEIASCIAAVLFAVSFGGGEVAAQAGNATLVDDIVGLRPGMHYDDVVAVLQGRDDVASVEAAEQWVRQSHGIPTRQLLRASNGVSCAAGEKVSRSGYHDACDTFGGRFEARKQITNEIIVAFTGMPGDEVARSLWRRSVFPQDRSPTMSTVIAALTEKYGEPHIRQTEAGYYSMSHRNGATNLNWIYSPEGARIVNSDAMKQRCVNGPKPWFTTQHSWNGACGLTVRAEILPVPGNSLLVQELNVSVVRQNDFIAALGDFDAALKAAVEQQAQGSATKPEL